MNAKVKQILLTIPAFCITLSLSGPLLADPPHGKGNGNGGPPGQMKKQQHGGGGSDRHAYDDRRNGGNIDIDIHFSSNQRVIIQDYYRDQYQAGHCPPGLAKKNNGCMPPGQAKKWRRGYPLPRDIIYYDLPPVIIARLDPPPRGYKYVRVAADILMIAIGTGMVIDAIEDLGSM